MTCEHCGKDFNPITGTQRFCCHNCGQQNWRQRNREQVKSPYLPIEQHERKQQRQIETDADQARIKREVDERYGIGHNPGRRIRKGSAEWNEIAATLTPPNRIRNGTSCYGWLYSAYGRGA